MHLETMKGEAPVTWGDVMLKVDTQEAVPDKLQVKDLKAIFL